MSLMPSTRGGGERAADRAQAADRDHDQHVHQVGEGEGRVEADHLDGERAAQPGEAAAEREGEHEGAVDVDAQAARHALVVDRRAHPRAEAGVLERDDQERRDREARRTMRNRR